MPLYTILIEADLFHRDIVPPLTESWQQRSFRPCQQLLATLMPAGQAFAAKYHIGPQDLLLLETARSLPFDRQYWQLLLGEILLVAATEIPEIEIDPDTLGCLFAPDKYPDEAVSRPQFSPIQQALYGTRDLAFGRKLFRPEHAGYNDVEDVLRLAAYLDAVDMANWSIDGLRRLPGLTEDVEREEELEHARAWFPLFTDLYRRAAGARQVIVAEIL